MSRKIDRARYGTKLSAFKSVDEFLNADIVPSGLITIVHNCVPIDILYHPGAGSDQALFMFHGAVDQKFTLPVFQGGGVTAGLKVHRIFISDPTLAISADDEFDKGLTLGWHSGNYRQTDLQSVITKIINKIINFVQAKRPVFHGISGGGFAALYYGAQFDDSIIVPINPQTEIERYLDWAVARWANIAFGIPESAERPISCIPNSIEVNVQPIFEKSLNTIILYMQNSDDHLHIDEHMVPFMRRVCPEIPFLLLKDYWGPRHSQPPKEVMSNALTAALSPSPIEAAKLLHFSSIN